MTLPLFDLHLGDCRDVMRSMDADSIDSIVSDPPYGLSFLGKGWDRGVPSVEFWAEALRVAKPGAHLLAFGGTRTYHRLACAIEDAGWEVRDMITWVSNKTFPKSLDVGKQVSKLNDKTKQWDGWGTALKPTCEPICLARKPLIGTVAENVSAHGTGGINVDACRVKYVNEKVPDLESWKKSNGGRTIRLNKSTAGVVPNDNSKGRWPANLIHDGSDEVVSEFPDNVKGGTWCRTDGARLFNNDGKLTNHTMSGVDSTTGSAARFFYCARASKQDREDGNTHPTVKPTALMRYLCKLVTPSNGIILDPFMGSGSTGKAAILEGFRFYGIDITPEYIDIARARIERANRQINGGLFV